MKHFKFVGKLFGFLGIILSSGILFNQAMAEPRVDINPQKIKFANRPDDDVSNRRSLHTYIEFRNDGNVTLNNRDVMYINVKGRVYLARIYGPAERGGSLGGPVRPGERGNIFVHLPLGYIGHCEQVNLHVDLRHRFQTGPAVFDNDQKTLQAVDMANRTVCLSRPIRIPRRPFPPHVFPEYLELPQDL